MAAGSQNVTLSVTIDANGQVAVQQLGQVAGAIQNLGTQSTASAGLTALAFNEILDAIQRLAGWPKAIIDIADSYNILAGRVRNLSVDQAQANAVMESLQQIATKTHAPLASVGELYARLATATKDLQIPQENLLRFTESISNALRINGTSAAEASGALLQLSQAMGAGALRGEEFNSVNEQMPAVLNAVAKYLGVTRGELKLMAEQGTLTTSVVMSAVQQMGTTWAAEAAKLPVTLNQALTDIETAWTEYLGQSETVKAASAALAAALESVANNLDTLVPATAAAALGIIGGQIAAMATAAGGAAGLLAKAGAALLNLFGGIPGVLAAATVAIGAWALSLKDGESEADRLKRKIEELKKAHQELTDAEAEAAVKADEAQQVRRAVLWDLIAQEEKRQEALRNTGSAMSAAIANAKAMGASEETLLNLEKAAKPARDALAASTDRLAQYQAELNGQMRATPADDLIQGYMRVSMAIDGFIASVDRLKKVRDAEIDATMAAAKANQAAAKYAGDEKGAIEALTPALQKQAEASKAAAYEARQVANAKAAEVEQLEKALATNPALQQSRQRELEDLRATAAILGSKATAAEAAAQSDAIAAKESERAAATFGDQADKLDYLRSQYNSAKALMDNYAASQQLAVFASRELGLVQSDLIAAREKLSAAEGAGAETVNALKARVAELTDRETELKLRIDDGKVSAEQETQARQAAADAAGLYRDALADAVEQAEREADARTSILGALDDEIARRNTLYGAQIKEIRTRADVAKAMGDESKAAELLADATKLEKEQKEYAVSVAYKRAAAIQAEADALRLVAERIYEQANADGTLEPAELTAIQNANDAADAKQRQADAARQVAENLDKQTQAENELAEATKAQEESAKSASSSTVTYTDTIKAALISLADEYASLGDIALTTWLRSSEANAQAWKQWRDGSIADMFARVREELERIKVAQSSVDSLIDKLNSGTFSAKELANAEAYARQNAAQLGEERLQTLRDSIADARQAMDDLRDSAKDALETALSVYEAAGLGSTELEREQISWAQTLAELQDQLAEAKAKNDAQAIADLERAIELQRKAHEARIAQIKAEAAAEAEAAKAAGSNSGGGDLGFGGTGKVTGGGSAGSGNASALGTVTGTGKGAVQSNSVASQKQSQSDTKQVTKVVEVQLKTPTDTVSLFTDEELTDKVIGILEQAKLRS